MAEMKDEKKGEEKCCNEGGSCCGGRRCCAGRTALLLVLLLIGGLIGYAVGRGRMCHMSSAPCPYMGNTPPPPAK